MQLGSFFPRNRVEEVPEENRGEQIAVKITTVTPRMRKYCHRMSLIRDIYTSDIFMAISLPSLFVSGRESCGQYNFSFTNEGTVISTFGGSNAVR